MLMVCTLYFFPVFPIRLRRVQIWARFGPTLFTTCMPRSSVATGGPRFGTRPARLETYYFFTSSLTLRFSSHATLLVSFSLHLAAVLGCIFSHVDTDTERTVVQARDAWIQADANRNKGGNKCLLWKTFASKGLGVNAANYIDDTSIPTDCN